MTPIRGHTLPYQLDLYASRLLPDELIALLLSAHIFSLACVQEVGRPLRQAIGKLLGQVPAGCERILPTC